MANTMIIACNTKKQGIANQYLTNQDKTCFKIDGLLTGVCIPTVYYYLISVVSESIFHCHFSKCKNTIFFDNNKKNSQTFMLLFVTVKKKGETIFN